MSVREWFQWCLGTGWRGRRANYDGCRMLDAWGSCHSKQGGLTVVGTIDLSSVVTVSRPQYRSLEEIYYPFIVIRLIAMCGLLLDRFDFGCEVADVVVGRTGIIHP